MSKDKTYDSFESEVWETLSRTDVSDHVESIEATKKRPEVKYLSWSVAWLLLKRKFPGSTYSHRVDIIHPDNTVEVEVDVVICKAGSETMFTNARLAVMDFYFGPIVNPTARETNDARQRCLVKALAFAGLGLNLWSDSAIPVGKLADPITIEEHQKLTDLIEETETKEETFLEWCEVEELKDLPYERYTSALRLLQAKRRRQQAEAKQEAE